MVAQDRFAPVLARFPDADAGTVWDPDSQTVTFRLVDNDQGRRARAALTALHLSLKVEFVVARKSSRDLMRAAGRLFATRGQWAPGLGGLGYIAPDVLRGRLILGVDERWVDEWRAAVGTADVGVLIDVRGEDRVGVIW